MDQQGYLRTFRERWIAIVLGILLGLGVASAIATSIPRSYSASATLFMSVQSKTGSLVERSQFSLARISSYPELAFSADVLGKTITQLGLDENVQSLGKTITASNPSGTVYVQVGATADSAEDAAAIANSVAANLSEAVSTLENSVGDDRYDVNLDLRSPAQVPTGPSAPQTNIILGLGGVGGLALGLIAAIIWGRLDTRIRTVAHARRISGLPVLGELPRLRGGVLGLVGNQPSARTAQKNESLFRETQLTIRQANAGAMPDLLLLVPASRTAGGPAVRLGFARAFAATGRSVALLEGDFGSTAGTTTGPGLAEILDGRESLSEAVVPVDGERFNVIPPGDPHFAPAEYVAEQNFPATLRDLRSQFDISFIEATSVSQPLSLQLVGPYADGVVVLVAYARTRSADLSHALARLRLIGVRPLGIVMTGVPAIRQSDLTATWMPGDFNEQRRLPIIPIDDVVETADVTSPPSAKRRPTARRKPAAAPRTAASARSESAADDLATLEFDDLEAEPTAEPAIPLGDSRQPTSTK